MTKHIVEAISAAIVIIANCGIASSVPFTTLHRNVTPNTEVSTNVYGSVTGVVDTAYVNDRLHQTVPLTDEQKERGITYVKNGLNQDQAIAIGENAVASVDPAYVASAPSNAILRSVSVAIGGNADARQDGKAISQSIAIGWNSQAKGINSIAIGSGAQHTNETAVTGDATVASNNETIAMGYGAKATANQSVQIGNGINSTPKSLKFYDTTIVENGKVVGEGAVIDVRTNGVSIVGKDKVADIEWNDAVVDTVMDEFIVLTGQQFTNIVTDVSSETISNTVDAKFVSALSRQISNKENGIYSRIGFDSNNIPYVEVPPKKSSKLIPDGSPFVTSNSVIKIVNRNYVNGLVDIPEVDVEDVTVNGISVVKDKIANIDTTNFVTKKDVIPSDSQTGYAENAVFASNAVSSFAISNSGSDIYLNTNYYWEILGRTKQDGTILTTGLLPLSTSNVGYAVNAENALLATKSEYAPILRDDATGMVIEGTASGFSVTNETTKKSSTLVPDGSDFLTQTSADAKYAPKAGPLETSTSLLTADGKLVQHKTGTDVPWQTEDGKKVFVFDSESGFNDGNAFEYTWCYPSVEDATEMLYVSASIGSEGLGADALINIQVIYATEEHQYESSASNSSRWTIVGENGSQGPYVPLGMPIKISYSGSEGLPAFTLVRTGWIETGDLSDALKRTSPASSPARIGWHTRDDSMSPSDSEELLLVKGDAERELSFGLRSSSGKQAISLFLGETDESGYGIRIGGEGTDGTTGKGFVNATGDVTAGNGSVSLLGLGNDYGMFKLNFDENVKTLVSENAPVTDVQFSGDGTSYSTCVSEKVAKIDLSGYAKKGESVAQSTAAWALSGMGANWNMPTWFVCPGVQGTGGAAMDPATQLAQSTAVIGFVFRSATRASTLTCDGTAVLTRGVADSAYQPVIGTLSTVKAGQVTLSSDLSGEEAVNASIKGGGVANRIAFMTANGTDAPSTLDIDGSPVLTQTLAGTLFAKKSDVKNAQFAVADGKPTAIEHGKFYSFKPLSTEDAALTLSTGFDDGEEDEARLFFDCGTAAPNVTFPSDVKVLYRDGSVKLDAMQISGNSTPNRYMVELKWFQTSASGTPVKYVIVNCYKVSE